jgi:thymidine phosphorylase
MGKCGKQVGTCAVCRNPETMRALAKMNTLIKAQGPKQIDFHPSNLSQEVVAGSDGMVISIF